MIRKRRREIPYLNPRDGIPRHLHHAWVGSRSIPEVEVECMATWHGQAQTYLWDDTDTLRVTGPSNYPRMAPTPSHMSDILRYFILLKCGGVWLDTDVECLRPGLLDVICNDPDIGFVFSDELPNTPGTAFIGSIPGHPLATKLLQAIAESDPKRWADSHVTTGPRLFAAVVNPILARLPGERHPYGTLYRDLGVLRMNKEFIYPTNPWQGEEFYRKDHPLAFTYHKCSSLSKKPEDAFTERTVDNYPVHVVTHSESPSFQSNRWRHSGARIFVSATTPGKKQRGCALGHLAALRAIDTFPTLVIEDDATPTAIGSMVTIPDGADLVFLGTSTWTAPKEGPAEQGQPDVRWRGRGWVNPSNMLSDTAWLVCTEAGRDARIAACERALRCSTDKPESHLDMSFVRRAPDSLVVFANRTPRFVQASEPSSTSAKIGAWTGLAATYKMPQTYAHAPVRLAFHSKFPYYAGVARWVSTLADSLNPRVVEVVAILVEEDIGDVVLPCAREMVRVRDWDGVADVIVTWGGEPSDVIKNFGVPIIGVSHGDAAGAWQKNAIAEMEQCCAAVVGVTRTAHHNYVYSGVSTDSITARHVVTKPFEKTLLFLGRAAHDKRPEVIPDVVDMLPENWGAVIVGDDCGLQIRDHSRVRIIGPSDDVGAWYDVADCVIIPSESEGFCYTMFEAWLARVPVVCGAWPVLREIETLAGEGLAEKVEIPGDPRDWASAVLRAKVSDKAWSLTRTEFSAEAMARRWEDYIVSLVRNIP